MSTENKEKLADSIYYFIQFIICYGEGFKPEELLNETRKQEYVFARHLIMYFAVKFKVGTLGYIGAKIGKDHATVLHSIKAINNWMETDKLKKAKIDYYDSIIKRVINISEKNIDLKAAMEPLEKEISALEQRCINLAVQVAFLKEKVTANV